MSSAEQRGAPRFPRAFMVRYRSFDEHDALWSISPLRDFSSKGAHFISEREFKIGDAMQLQLILPPAKDPIWVQGRVVWAKTAPWGMVELRVEFMFDPNDPKLVEAEKVIADVAAFLHRRASRYGS